MTQHTITLPHGRVLLVEVPEDSHTFNDTELEGEYRLHYFGKAGFQNERLYQVIPSGKWQLLSITPLIEEQAANGIDVSKRWAVLFENKKLPA